MTFYESSKVKERLNIRSADSTSDTLISNLGSQADSEILEKLRFAREERNISSLPAISTSSSDIPQMIKDASTDRVVAYVFLSKQRREQYDKYLEKSNQAVEDYITLLSKTKILYGDYVWLSPFEEIVIDKLNNLENRLNETCKTLTEVKTTQFLFIKKSEEEIAEAKQKQERKFDKRIALVAIAIATFEIIQLVNGSF